MTFTIPSVFTAIDKFTSPVSKMMSVNKAFANSASAGIAKQERLFRKLTPALSEAGKQFLSFASAAAIAGGILMTLNFSINAIREYEDALASMQAVTGASNKEFSEYRKQVELVAKETKKNGIEVAKAFELIGSAKPELLANAEALGTVTKSAIILSQASRDDLATSAMNLTGVMNQFNLSADQSDMAINVLSAGAKVGSASISSVSEAMKNFGSVAAGANMSLEQSVALTEVLGKFSVFGAEAGTKLRGSVLKLQQAGVGYASGQFEINDALTEAKSKIDLLKTAKQKDAAILKMFGAENIATGKILLDNIALFQEYTLGVTGTDEAHKQAAVNTDTFNNVLNEAKNAWINLVTSSSEASDSLSTAKEVIRFVTNNMGELVTIATTLIGLFLAWKAILVISSVWLALHGLVIGISTFLLGKSALALRGNTAALFAYKAMTMLATTATGSFAVALGIAGLPIWLIAAAIIALIALIGVIIYKWEEWGAAVSLFMGPLGMVISLIQSFRRNWDMIVETFKSEGIIAGIKAIGVTILDAVLMPIQQVMELIAKFTGAEWASAAVQKIEAFRTGLGVSTDTNAINPKAAEQDALANRIESTKTYQSLLMIEDKSGKANLENENPFIKFMPKIGSTLNPSF